MQTTFARRQRRRRALQRRPQGRTGPLVGRILAVLLLFLLVTTGLMAGTGALVAVSAYNYYASGLPDPVAALTNIEFEQQTVIYDRTGKEELARLGELKRELVTFEELPGETLDATTAIEDKDFWINPGFDPIGIVSAGMDTLARRPRSKGRPTSGRPGRSSSPSA
jgi:membrane carboxypeptidase/penicillin-binding protein